jgi:hypothetical protein
MVLEPESSLMHENAAEEYAKAPSDGQPDNGRTWANARFKSSLLILPTGRFACPAVTQKLRKLQSQHHAQRG